QCIDDAPQTGCQAVGIRHPTNLATTRDGLRGRGGNGRGPETGCPYVVRFFPPRTFFFRQISAEFTWLCKLAGGFSVVSLRVEPLCRRSSESLPQPFVSTVC